MKIVDRRINKAVHYTITPIGGQNELKLWKADQERQQAEWDAGKDKRYAVAKDRTVSSLVGERKVTFTLPEIQEMAYRKVISQDVVEYAKRPDNVTQNRNVCHKSNPQIVTCVVAPKPHKKTLFERAITYVKSVFSRT